MIFRISRCTPFLLRQASGSSSLVLLGVVGGVIFRSDFGKFTTEDPRSTNEEDPEAWRRRKGVHLEIRKITRTTHVLTLGMKKFSTPHQQRSRISENSPPKTPGAPMRRILKPGGGGKVYISRYEKSPAPPMYSH